MKTGAVNLNKWWLLGIVLMGPIVFTMGCGHQGDERLKEKAKMEAEVSTDQEIEAGKQIAEEGLKAENENIAKWSGELEEDLQTRQRFFRAIQGTFEGEIKSGQTTYVMRLKLVPSIPPYSVNRTRTLEEIRFELLNLYFKVLVQRWKKGKPATSVGCRFEEIRPDMERGQVNLASEDCANFYSVNIAGPDVGSAGVEKILTAALSGQSAELSAMVLNDEEDSIDTLVGEINQTLNSTVLKFLLKRVEPTQ